MAAKIHRYLAYHSSHHIKPNSMESNIHEWHFYLDFSSKLIMLWILVPSQLSFTR